MPQARAAKGSCNPAPDPYHVVQYSKGNGEVFVEVGYGWDGVSVFPACKGPLVGARVSNTSAVTTWYAVFTRPRGGVRVIEFPPGTQRTYTATQLSAVGLDTREDIDAFQLTRTPPA